MYYLLKADKLLDDLFISKETLSENENIGSCSTAEAFLKIALTTSNHCRSIEGVIRYS
jgi:hypothetical protein